MKREQLSVSPFGSATVYRARAIAAYDLETLSVEAEDFEKTTSLPDDHADPFDRIIIAQVLERSCAVVTYDKRFSAYDDGLLQ